MCCGACSEKEKKSSQDHAGNMRRHELTDGSISEDRLKMASRIKNSSNLKCPLCGQICADKELLITHMKDHQKDKRVVDPDDPDDDENDSANSYSDIE